MHGERNIGTDRIKVLICDKCEGESEQDDIIQRFNLLELKESIHNSKTARLSFDFDLHSRCYSMIKNNLRNLFGLSPRDVLVDRVRELIAERQEQVQDREINIFGN